MTENNGGGAPSQQDLNSWANQHGLTHPILADPSGSQLPYVVIGYPTYVVIDQTMTIVNADLWPFDANYITSLL